MIMGLTGSYPWREQVQSPSLQFDFLCLMANEEMPFTSAM